jgi:hypothetical protein
MAEGRELLRGRRFACHRICEALISIKKKPTDNTQIFLAEDEGFEPSVPLLAHLFSRQAHSTTLAILRDSNERNCIHFSNQVKIKFVF